MKKRHLVYIYSIVCSLIAVLVVSCANRGVGPTGGPKDETPPVLKEEVPANGTTNYKESVISLLFDEYLQLNDAANQVFISPPQSKQPIVKAVGKRVTVSFEEELADSTTYTIDFGEAICDYNEKNPVKGYVYSFSTGPEIDSLQISGVLINAMTLNPVSGMLVGIHSCLHDSAISSYPFTRIARTDSTGAFCVRNIHPGNYRLYALNDVSKDYIYQPGEGLAFLDSIFIPTATDSLLLPPMSSSHTDSMNNVSSDSVPVAVLDSIKPDSIMTDSVKPDSVASDSLKMNIPRVITFYEPKDILLRYFVEDKQRHYFGRCLRDEQHLIQLTFAAPQDSVPVFKFLTTPLEPNPLEVDSIMTDSLMLYADSLVQETDSMMYEVDSLKSDVVGLLSHVDSLQITTDSTHVSAEGLMPDTLQKDIPDAIVIQSSLHNDTITIWMTDSSFIKQDTIVFVMTYMMSDSLYNLVPRTDTLKAIYRAPRLSPSAKAALDKKKLEKKPLELKSNASNKFDIYQPLVITFPEPLSQFNPDSLHLFEKVDSIKKAMSFEIRKADACGMRFEIKKPWKAETDYELAVDSAAFVSAFGSANNKTSLKWKVVSLEEYASLKVKIEPFQDNMMLQLLDEKDNPVRTLRATKDGVLFQYLKPASYFLRAYLDLNGDSVWTTGDWAKKRQPEPMYYYPQKLTLRANWDFEELFKYLERSVLLQKPQEIRKEEKNKSK